MKMMKRSRILGVKNIREELVRSGVGIGESNTGW